MINGYEDMIEFGKGNVEALVKSSTLAAKGFEEITKAYQSFAGHSAEKVNEAVKAMAACKTPQDVIALQTKLAREGMDSFIAESRKFVEMTTAVVSSSVEPLNERFAAFQKVAKVA